MWVKNGIPSSGARSRPSIRTAVRLISRTQPFASSVTKPTGAKSYWSARFGARFLAHPQRACQLAILRFEALDPLARGCGGGVARFHGEHAPCGWEPTGVLPAAAVSRPEPLAHARLLPRAATARSLMPASVMERTITGSSPSVGATRRALSSIVFLPIFGKACSTLKSRTCAFFGSTSSSSARKRGNVPLPVAEIVKQLALHGLRVRHETACKKPASPASRAARHPAPATGAGTVSMIASA